MLPHKSLEAKCALKQVDKTKWRRGEKKMTLGSRYLFRRQSSLHPERTEGQNVKSSKKSSILWVWDEKKKEGRNKTDLGENEEFGVIQTLPILS